MLVKFGQRRSKTQGHLENEIGDHRFGDLRLHLNFHSFLSVSAFILVSYISDIFKKHFKHDIHLRILMIYFY